MTMVELKGYRLNWDTDARAWKGPGAPASVVEFANRATPDPDAYDPNPAQTRAHYLQKNAGAKILSVDPTEPTREGVAY